MGSSGRVDGVTIVSTVRKRAGDSTLRLAQQVRPWRGIIGVAIGQHMGSDLADGGVQAEMQLKPSSASTAVPARTPFTVPE